MKKKVIIMILIFLLVGVIYAGLWAMGGMSIGSGQPSMNNTQNGDSQSGTDANSYDDSSLGNNSSSTERSGIVIDKDLLNRKIEILTEETKKEATTTKTIATSTEITATSTPLIKPIVASTTDGVETASSSNVDLIQPVTNASSSIIKSVQPIKKASTTTSISQ